MARVQAENSIHYEYGTESQKDQNQEYTVKQVTIRIKVCLICQETYSVISHIFLAMLCFSASCEIQEKEIKVVNKEL